ncbi:MAG: hypothetical protein HFH14_10655 [Lachnospiraceae bacterium]|nr:hypothetical protein [Lachnospiraceae bacterium]
MNTLSSSNTNSFKFTILVKYKKLAVFSSIILIACILSVLPGRIIHANNNSDLYTCGEYSANIPESFTVDAETLQDYTSFYGDSVTIGVRVTDNTTGENITTFTETEIRNIATETLSALMAQAGEGINIKEHSITTFSDREYPALYISFAGSTELDDSVYMEEYIITTVSYKYTIVFSADNKELLDTDDVRLFMNSFTTTEAPLRQVIPADNGTLNVILALCAATVVLFLIATILIIRKRQK